MNDKKVVSISPWHFWFSLPNQSKLLLW